MFTGLIEEVGRVVSLEAQTQGPKLQIVAPRIAEKIRIGDSIAVDGCCLTVAASHHDQLTFDLLEETLDRTNFKTLRRDRGVNLERALAADGRLGGHFVQGHVDCTARILLSETKGADQRLELELPAEFAHYVASKGSIAVNGVSLTVAEILPESFVVWIIPHTGAQTNLGTARAGASVNLEFDLIAKYLERLMERKAVRPA
jgi:riboflavin synthase